MTVNKLFLSSAYFLGKQTDAGSDYQNKVDSREYNKIYFVVLSLRKLATKNRILSGNIVEQETVTELPSRSKMLCRSKGKGCQTILRL